VGLGVVGVPFPTAYETAVTYGNTEVADLLMAAGAQTSSLDPTRQFVAACLRADHPTVRRLLADDPGLAERAHNAPGVPEPVHVAIVLGRPEVVALAVTLGFPIDEDWCGWGPPLHTAALSGQLDIVRLLVELGADPTVEAPNDSGAEFIPQDRTALGWARYNDHHDVVAYLSNLTSD
jgi:ankyrin repeat protein